MGKKPDKKFSGLRGCSKWVLAAVAAAAAAHYAGNPVYAGVDWNAALQVESAHHGGLSFDQIRALPTWSLRAVAEAAAKRPGHHGMYTVRCQSILTEFERRRAKRLEREAAEKEMA